MAVSHNVCVSGLPSPMRKLDDAEWETEQVLTNDPGFKLNRLAHVFPFNNPEDLKRFNVALSKVGFENRW